MTDPVITVKATVFDGTVVRWHRSLTAAENHHPFLSASRNGVMVHGEYLTDIPDELVAAARAAYEELRRNHDADLKHLATHRNRGFPNGPLEPVQKEQVS